MSQQDTPETAWKRTGHCQVRASLTRPESRLSRTGCAIKLVSLRSQSCQELSWICSLFRLSTRTNILVLWRSETVYRGPQPWSGITYNPILLLKQHLSNPQGFSDPKHSRTRKSPKFNLPLCIWAAKLNPFSYPQVLSCTL